MARHWDEFSLERSAGGWLPHGVTGRRQSHCALQNAGERKHSFGIFGVETVEEFAQTALDALKAGEAWLGKASKCSEVWLDGQILKGEWKNSGRPGPPPAGGPRNEAGRSDDFAQAARVA